MAKVAARQERFTSGVSASKLRTKKRSRDFSRTIVTTLSASIIAQAIAALYLSPFFSVTTESVSIRASPLCSEAQVRSLIHADLPRSIVRIPAQRWKDALSNLPAVKSATIRSSFPNRVSIEVRDRQPLLVSDLGLLGSCVLDSDLVPFRTVQPIDSTLPTLVVKDRKAAPELGVSVADTAHVNGISTIMKWLRNHNDVSIAALTLHNQHLSFVIKPSNVTVMLGTPRRLDEKLASLDILLRKRPDLLSSRKYSAINLFSDEYPALVIRSNSGENSDVP